MDSSQEQRVKEDEKKAEQLLQSISKDEERVREQVQRLGDLHAQFNNQFLKYLRAITENDAFTHLKELPPPKTWDLISYEVDIQHEGFEFKSIREDVRHVATYKIASALEEPLIQISYAYAEGFRWIRHCDSMKEEAILYQHHGGCLRYFNLHLQRRRKDFLQALEAMELGLGRAEASLKLNLSSLRDDPGYAKHTTSYPKDTLQNLFRQVLDSINGEWREKDVDVVNAKLLPVYQREFVLAMNDATPWNGRLEKACDTCREIRSLITKPNDNDTHRKRKIPSHPTLHSKAPAKKFRLKLESAVKSSKAPSPLGKAASDPKDAKNEARVIASSSSQAWGERFGNVKDKAEGVKKPGESLIVKLKSNSQKRKRGEASEGSSIEKQALSPASSSVSPPPLRQGLIFDTPRHRVKRRDSFDELLWSRLRI